jgi:hypothetical protein
MSVCSGRARALRLPDITGRLAPYRYNPDSLSGIRLLASALWFGRLTSPEATHRTAVYLTRRR